MYDIVKNIIDHEWISNYTSDQQYIYYICGALVILFAVVFIDIIRSIFLGFFRG